MHANNLTGFTAQELAASQPNTFLWERGTAFTQNQVWFSKPVIGMNCPYLVCRIFFPFFLSRFKECVCLEYSCLDNTPTALAPVQGRQRNLPNTLQTGGNSSDLSYSRRENWVGHGNQILMACGPAPLRAELISLPMVQLHWWLSVWWAPLGFLSQILPFVLTSILPAAHFIAHL